ncbi:hypothetical protein ABPG72_022404 [Tetrahymena utriculariae]
MKINFLILNLLAIFFNISVQKEYLVSTDFINPNSNLAQGWSLPQTTYYCNNTLFSDWSGQKYYTGVLVQGQNQNKTFTQLPPHWSLSVRFDLLLSGCLNSANNDVFKIYIDNTQVDQYTKNPNDGLKICMQNSDQGTCNDELVLYQKNITHSNSSVFFSSLAQTSQGRNVQGFCFKNFYLYVDTCDITCATCNGPTSNQCLSCPVNSTLSSNTCICRTGFIQHLYSCVSTCPTGYVKSNTQNICIQDYTQNCSSPDLSNQICTACSSQFLYQGYCVASCPYTSTLSNGVCVDFTTSLINGTYILNGLFNNYFGQSEILGLGLVISNFKGLTSSFGSSGALTTNCGTNHILGGFWLSGSGATISRSWTGLAPHWSIRVGYTLWKIDQWNNQNFNVTADSTVVQLITYGSNAGTSDLCGFNNQPDLFQNQVANFTHNSTTLTINFRTNLTNNVSAQSFGLSNLYVLVDYCTSNCISCGASGCLVCQSQYYLYKNVCLINCPSSTYVSNLTTCVDCNSNCKTCNSPGNICTSCNSPNFLNPGSGLTCLPTCPVSYCCSGSLYLDISTNSCNSTCPQDISTNSCNSTCPQGTYPDGSTNICSNCDANCATCYGGTSSNCLTCNLPLSYQKSTSECISSCTSGQYLDTNTNNCTQCDSSCLNCFGGSKKQCVDCQLPRYFQKLTTSCELQCQPNQYGNSKTAMCEQCDNSCATCSGPSNNQCLSCENSLFYLQTSGACVSNCPSGYFQNNLLNQCQKCDSTCKECSGTSNTQCTSCSSQLIFYNNQCLTQCPSGLFIQQSNNSCVPCDQSCESCNGQSSSSCLSCKPGAFLFSNQCVSKCPDGYYQNDNECSLCHSSCQTCTGPNSNQCQTCVDSLIKQNSSCVAECPKQMYMIQTPYKQCIQCHFYCTSGCNGSTKEDCFEIKPMYQIIVYILVFKSFIWMISIIVGFLKDNSQQILPLQKVVPLKIQKEPHQDHINNNQFDQKHKNSSLIEYQQNDPNLSPSFKVDDFNIDQGNKSPNIPINERGNIANLPQTNNNLMQSKNQLTFNNEFNQEDKSPESIRKKRRFHKIDFILKSNTQNEPLKSQTLSNMQKDQQLFPQDQTTANRSFVSVQNSPTKKHLLSLQNDKNKDQYSANEKLKYSFLYNEWINLFIYYDNTLSRVLRGTLIYVKYQIFFLTCQYFKNENYYFSIICLALGFISKSVLETTLKYLLQHIRKANTVFQLMHFTAIGLYLWLWFLPQINTLNYVNDKAWSIIYLITFSIDLLVLNQFAGFISYLSSIKYLNLENADKTIYKFFKSNFILSKLKKQ